jgi:thiamine pyrophosphate-dependent acetolactate synthase large subunit-like protein
MAGPVSVRSRTSDVIADELVSMGVTTVFALMSEEIARLMVSLNDLGVMFVGTRHEAGAVGMADGFGRASGRPGVALVGRGPGLTNALTALTTAARAGSPLLMLTGAPVSEGAGLADPKYIDQAAVLAATGITAIQVDSAATCRSTIRSAYARAAAGEAVVVNLPMDILNREAADDHNEPLVDFEPRHPADDDVAAVADLLQETWAVQRPLIVAGRGAVQSGSLPDLIELAELIGALVGTTLQARSFFVGDPFDVGIVGTFSGPATTELVSGADVILAFGASLGPFTTYRGDLFRESTIIHVDSNAAVFDRHIGADVSVHADARLTARALVDELRRRKHNATGYRRPEVAEQLAAEAKPVTFSHESRAGAVDPRTLMVELDRMLPKDRFVIVDPGHHLSFSAAHLSPARADAFVLSNDFGAIGSGPAIALGVATARRDVTTVLAVGDGGFMMALADIQTAAVLRLPIVIIVFDDGALGAEVHFLQVIGLSDELARLQNPSFEAVGRSLGITSKTIASLEDLEELGPLLNSLDGPVLLDCKIDGNVRGDWVEFYYGGM